MPSRRDRFTVLALGGDGIGPEVVNAGLEVLQAAADAAGLRVEVEEDLLHAAAWERYGTFCRDETVARAQVVDAVLVGAVGDPRYDEYLAGDKLRNEDADAPASRNPVDKDGLMRLRRELDVYAGLRPARAFDALVERTPFRPELVRGTDLMVVRELCGGAYFGLPRGIEQLPDSGRRAFDATVYTEAEIERIARTGLELARRRWKRLLSVDKANVMESGMLWREVVSALGARDYRDVALTHYLRRQRRLSARSIASRFRRRPRGQPARRPPLGPGRRRCGQPRHAALGIACRSAAERRAGEAGNLRARARQCARYCGPGNRKPVRHNPLRGDDVRIRLCAARWRSPH